MRRILLGLALLAGGAMVVMTPFALAASLGGVTAQTVGAATAVVLPCSGSAVTIDTVQTAFYATTNRYEIRSFNMTNTPTACQSQPCKLTVADDATNASLASDANLTAACTMPSSAAATVYTFASGAGPDLNAIGNTSSQVKFVLLVTGP